MYKLQQLLSSAIRIDHFEICESYNCHFVPKIDSQKRIKKVLDSNEINAELNKLKNYIIDRSAEQSVNSEMCLFRFLILQ